MQFLFPSIAVFYELLKIRSTGDALHANIFIKIGIFFEVDVALRCIVKKRLLEYACI